MRARKLVILLAVVAALAVVVSTRGIPAPTPNPPNTFSFAVMGDAPYIALHGETLRYRLVLKDLDAHDLSFVLHIGDIFWYPCSDARYRRTLDEFNALRHPVIYIPGDNEWADCWTETTGSFDPLERLTRLRQIFYAAPTQSLGGRRVAVVSQGGGDRFSEFVEHVRWRHDAVLFATVNLPGSANARQAFPGRTAANDEAATRRMDAAVAWLHDTFAEARATDASAVVIGFHANPSFEAPVDDGYRQNYEPFLTALEEEVEQFGKPVLVAQGDDHHFIVDHPLVRRTTGRPLENLTRLQVPGSPDVGWVKVVASTGPHATFTFENRVVPRWKHW
jgi:Calcineurin-like phosphoesterase